MIVQTRPEGVDEAFVVRQLDHTRFAGELARHFGNDRFEAIEPRDHYEYLVTHHDEGWDQLDDRWLQDPDTGLPYHLVRTPLDELVATGSRSPDLNGARHPFCGLLSSMHTYGLYNGRYGMSDFLFVEAVPADLRPTVDAMLDAELARQERLKAELRADPATAHLAEDAVLLRAYKALQFFDTFALYCQCEHPAARAEASFPNVPVDLDPDHDVTIHVRPAGPTGAGPDTYLLDPYPFDTDGLLLATPGRFLAPQPAGADLAQAWLQAPPAEQAVLLRSG